MLRTPAENDHVLIRLDEKNFYDPRRNWTFAEWFLGLQIRDMHGLFRTAFRYCPGWGERLIWTAASFDSIDWHPTAILVQS